MLGFDERQRIRLDESLSAYAQKLVEDGAIERQVDLVLLGFSYAVKEKIRPAATSAQSRDLVPFSSIREWKDERNAIECVVNWYAKDCGATLKDEKDLLDFFCRVGNAGAAEIRTKTQALSKSPWTMWVLRAACKSM